MRTPAAGLLVAGVLLLSAGCGSDDGGTATDPAPTAPTSSTAPAAAHPDCATVWVEGSRLAAGYRGCDADGTFVAARRIECSSGQTIVRYDNRYWAVRGGLIKAVDGGLNASKAYLDDLGTCLG